MIKKQNGQAIVEFALIIIVYIVFVFGLISSIWWITSGFFAQQAAHETARKFAVTDNKADAELLGRSYASRWAAIFIEPDKTIITVEKKDAKMAKSTVTVQSRFSFIVFSDYKLGTITRTAQSPYEDFIRNPHKYK